MEVNELLLHLIKKLESGEIRFLFIDKKVNESGKRECILKATSVKAVKIGELKEVGSDKTLFSKKYDEDWNKDFIEKFYKEKGIKCWVKDCPNKVCAKKGDHQKLGLQCIDDDGFHRRIVCNSCSETDYIHQLIDGVF